MMHTSPQKTWKKRGAYIKHMPGKEVNKKKTSVDQKNRK